jgi:hypothetical protein
VSVNSCNSLLLILCLLYKEMGLRNTEDDALDPNVEMDSGKGELLLPLT